MNDEMDYARPGISKLPEDKRIFGKKVTKVLNELRKTMDNFSDYYGTIMTITENGLDFEFDDISFCNGEVILNKDILKPERFGQIKLETAPDSKPLSEYSREEIDAICRDAVEKKYELIDRYILKETDKPNETHIILKH